jgi:MOSC domain-containing protein YiiM
MKIVSVNVGLPRGVTWQGKVVTTGIFKEPVEAPVMMRKLNLDRDGQADLTVHGGVKKRFTFICRRRIPNRRNGSHRHEF